MFADVTSANIVGYQNIATEDGGHVMVAPTFFTVGGENGCKLTDLSVTGYPPVEVVVPGKVYRGGCAGGKFILRKMNLNGTYKVSYYWIDTGKIGPGWFADMGGTAIEGGADKVTFDANEGAWVLGTAYKLVSAGQVNTKEVLAPTQDGGHVIIGNGTPVDLTLADLSATNYPPVEVVVPGKVYRGGCAGGKFIVRKMNLNGTYKVSYYWIDTGKIGPGWFADMGGTPIDGGAESVEVKSGEALWVLGTGYDLVVPGIKGL